MTPDLRFYRPLPGRKVRLPGSPKVLPADGLQLPWSSYWERRVRDGDVEEFTPAPEAKASPAKDGQ
ncbi:MAG TPA: DUF2635 domain-containing protein [Caulobacteraceae bacterium]|nr:DUF2635 domain-containing protein [Caulobacteraceae bacterium]